MFPYKIEIAGKRKDVESIYCIGRNYVDHIDELKNEKPDKPLVFVKPKGAILLDKEIRIPQTTSALHHECEILLSVGKSGENISKEQALNHIDGISLGLDFTARDLQDVEKQKGHPWTLSKCQKGFAVIGTWQSFVSRSYKFHLAVNGTTKQSGDTDKMIYSFADIITYLSSIIPLFEGDIIYTGTPAGVSSVKTGDLLSGYLEDKKLFEISIR
jgi:acylpyruvate hydrolase